MPNYPFSQRKPFETATRSNQGMYHSQEWRLLRTRRLMDEPYCRECRKEQRLITATDVDHIQPPRGDRTLFFSYSNTSSLCRSHHNQKTGQEIAARQSRRRPQEQHPGLVGG